MSGHLESAISFCHFSLYPSCKREVRSHRVESPEILQNYFKKSVLLKEQFVSPSVFFPSFYLRAAVCQRGLLIGMDYGLSKVIKATATTFNVTICALLLDPLIFLRGTNKERIKLSLTDSHFHQQRKYGRLLRAVLVEETK